MDPWVQELHFHLECHFPPLIQEHQFLLSLHFVHQSLYVLSYQEIQAYQLGLSYQEDQVILALQVVRVFLIPHLFQQGQMDL